jgi:similar to stage IV sporulation protein
MLKRLITYLLGHLRIEVRGGSLERFLNLALAQGIYLWDIERTELHMRASITLGDFWALRLVARGSHCRVRIRGRYGFPFIVSRTKRRPALIAGALVCLAFIFWASGHVWIIKVTITPPQNLDRRAVEAVAAEAGLKRGVWAGSVDLKRVEQHIQERMGEVSWAIVRVQGTRAVIEIVEKAALPRVQADQAGCVNLVARKQGVVEQVIPFQGEPVVKQGDIVQEGDLLVECAFKYWAGGRPAVFPGTPLPPRQDVARIVVAQAIVRARVAYQKYWEVPLTQEVLEPTGRTATRWVLKWRDKPIIVRGEEHPSQDGVPFARYRESRRTYSFGSWRNWRSPVELVMVSAEEVNARKERIPQARALEQARERMAAQLRWLLGPSDQVLTPLSAKVETQGPDFLGIRVTVETLEEIAWPRAGQPLPLPVPPQPETNPVRP